MSELLYIVSRVSSNFEMINRNTRPLSIRGHDVLPWLITKSNTKITSSQPEIVLVDHLKIAHSHDEPMAWKSFTHPAIEQPLQCSWARSNVQQLLPVLPSQQGCQPPSLLLTAPHVYGLKFMWSRSTSRRDITLWGFRAKTVNETV